MTSNYITYHLHTEDSLLDSCTNYKLYVNQAKELGQDAIAFTEHGNIFQWIEKKMYCDQVGIKYIHGMECYLTESFDENIRDNFHTILLAKNYEGVKEINNLFTLSHQEDHFYYKPRISFEEFLGISDNVIKTSACLQSPLYYHFTNQINLNQEIIRHYDFFEIQYHNIPEQIEYNKWLLNLSHQYNIPLIAGTDTHSLNQYKAECRSILLNSKGIEYSDEDSFDLTYQSYDQLVEKFTIQSALPLEEILTAINNTNIMADMVETFDLDLSFKYPILYGDNDRDVLINTIKEKLQYKLNNNIINKDDLSKYMSNIKEELKVFDEIGMTGFMLFMSEMITWCWENSIPVGYCRGSVGGSTIAYITDIIDVNPIQWDTIFSRFANKDRKEIGDIDIDVSPSQRDLVFDYIINRFGADKTAYVLSMGTIQNKGCIDLIGRALNSTWLKEHGDNELNPYSLDNMKIIKDKFELNEEATKKEYPDLFYYYDGLIGTIISQSHHPAGIIASPINLDSHYGCFTDSEGHKILSINMEEAHEVSLVKYDILGLQNIQIIKDTCALAGIPYPKSHLVNWNDNKVWDDMIKSPTGIFQFESDYAFNCLCKMNPHAINDMSLTNAAIRPSGDSYREDLFAGKVHKNPSEIIDELLSANRGFLVFQEDTIKFLKDICGLEGSEADNVRRAIGRKQVDRLQKALPQILEGYCNVSTKPRDIAEEEAKEFLQIIEDSSNYQFGYNHSTGYSMIGYTCAMLRYYYPLEFCTSYLNNVRNDDDILNGTKLTQALGIPICDIKFGKSESKYTMDKENNCIYKGIASIKYCNDIIAEELLALNSHYDSFISLLQDIKDKTSLNSRQLDILIKLNFFSDFGKNKYLLQIVDIYNKFSTCKQIAKKNIPDLSEQFGLTEFILKKYCAKETAAQYRDVDNVGLMQALIDKLENKSLSITEQMIFENEALGYINYRNNKIPSYYWIVTEFKTYKDINKPYITLRRLHDGYEVHTKIKKAKVFKAEPFKKYSILLFDNLTEEHKMKLIDGVWKETDETELILNVYNVLRQEVK